MDISVFNVYYKYFDYLFFGVGFIFVTLGALMLIFFRQRKVWIKSQHYFLFILFVLFIGFSTWNELFLMVYNSNHNFELTKNIFYYLSYPILFEFGRRELFPKETKYTLILYVVPFLLLYLDLANYIFAYFILIGMLMSANGLFRRLKRKKLTVRSDYFKLIVLNILPVLYVFLKYTNILIIFSQEHELLKYVFEWTYTFLIFLLFIRNFINILSLDTLDYQLKGIKIRTIKSTISVLAVVYLFGFFLTNYMGEEQLAKEKENLLQDIQIAAISLEGIEYLLLDGNLEEINSDIYNRICLKLNELKGQFNYAETIYSIFYHNDNLIYGVSTLPESEVYDIYGSYINKTSVLNEVIEEGKSIIGEYQNDIIAYAPIRNSSEKTVAILAIDILTEQIYQSVLFERFRGILIIFIAFLIVIGINGIYYVNRREFAWRSTHLKILASIGDMVGVIDKHGKIIYANNAAYNLMNYSPNNLQKKYYINDFLNKEDAHKLAELMKKVKEDEILYSELNLNTLNSEQIPVYGSISYLDYLGKDKLYVFTAMNITDQKKRELEMQNYFHNTVSLLATVVDAKDNYTARHSTNVAKYAKAIAKEIGFNEDEIKEIETAAFIHDIGKIGIPDMVLNKNGPLNDSEWLEMKKHPEYGKEILEKADNSFKELIPYVYLHHERYDGKGYPNGIKNTMIPIAIISVADAFDAMTSNRSYRKRMTVADAKEEIIKNSGTQFHPEVVKALVNMLERDFEFLDPEPIDQMIIGNLKLI